MKESAYYWIINRTKYLYINNGKSVDNGGSPTIIDICSDSIDDSAVSDIVSSWDEDTYKEQFELMVALAKSDEDAKQYELYDYSKYYDMSSCEGAIRQTGRDGATGAEGGGGDGETIKSIKSVSIYKTDDFIETTKVYVTTSKGRTLEPFGIWAQRGPQGAGGAAGSQGSQSAYYNFKVNFFEIFYGNNDGVNPGKPTDVTGVYNAETGKVVLNFGDGSKWAENDDNLSDFSYEFVSTNTYYENSDGTLTNEGWSFPTLIKEPGAGSVGEDTDNIEYIYYLSSAENKDKALTIYPSIAYPDETYRQYSGYVPKDWTNHPQGITELCKYELRSSRSKRNFSYEVDGVTYYSGSEPKFADNTIQSTVTNLSGDSIYGSWSDFTTPVMHSYWGHDGVDGDGLEYMYILTKSKNDKEKLQEILDDLYLQVSASTDYQNVYEYVNKINKKYGYSITDTEYSALTEDEQALFTKGDNEDTDYYISWTDSPREPLVNLEYQFVAIRKKSNKVWGNYSVSYWNRYVTNGEPGTGISIKGSCNRNDLFAFGIKSDSDKWYCSISKNITEQYTSELGPQGIGVQNTKYYPTLTMGDCYVCDDGNLYVFDGNGEAETPTGADALCSEDVMRGYAKNHDMANSLWINAGEIKGSQGAQGDRGTQGNMGLSTYIHIKYAVSLSQVDTSGKPYPTVDELTDGTGENISGARYEGRLVNFNPTDDVDNTLYNLSSYTWHRFTGNDGLGNEFIFCRTKENNPPCVPYTYNSEGNKYFILEKGSVNNITTGDTKYQKTDFIPLYVEYTVDDVGELSYLVYSGTTNDDFVNDGHTQWTDNPKGVNSTWKYEWICQRKSVLGDDIANGNDGKAIWQDFIGSDDKQVYYKFTYTDKKGNKNTEYTTVYPESTDDITVNSVEKNEMKNVYQAGLYSNYGEAKEGATGMDGLIIYPAGVYDSDTIYTRTKYSTPYVMYGDEDGNYTAYIFYNGGVQGSASGKTPTNTTYWIKADKYKAIYAEMAIIDYGKFGSAVFCGDYMFSQYGQIYDLQSDGKTYGWTKYDADSVRLTGGTMTINGENYTIVANPNLYQNFYKYNPYFENINSKEESKEYERLQDKDNYFRTDKYDNVDNVSCESSFYMSAYLNRTESTWSAYTSESKTYLEGINIDEKTANTYVPFRPAWCVNLKSGTQWTSNGWVKFNYDGSGNITTGITWDSDGNITFSNDVDVLGTLNSKNITVGGGTSEFNMDGSGYVANDNISWDAYGNLTLKNVTNYGLSLASEKHLNAETMLDNIEILECKMPYLPFVEDLRKDYADDDDGDNIFYNQYYYAYIPPKKLANKVYFYNFNYSSQTNSGYFTEKDFYIDSSFSFKTDDNSETNIKTCMGLVDSLDTVFTNDSITDNDRSGASKSIYKNRYKTLGEKLSDTVLKYTPTVFLQITDSVLIDLPYFNFAECVSGGTITIDKYLENSKYTDKEKYQKIALARSLVGVTVEIHCNGADVLISGLNSGVTASETDFSVVTEITNNERYVEFSGNSVVYLTCIGGYVTSGSDKYEYVTWLQGDASSIKTFTENKYSLNSPDFTYKYSYISGWTYNQIDLGNISIESALTMFFEEIENDKKLYNSKDGESEFSNGVCYQKDEDYKDGTLICYYGIYKLYQYTIDENNVGYVVVKGTGLQPE